MSTFLLIVIYIAFIGLGLPDSLFGAAWPAICLDFGTGLSAASFVTVTVSGCTVVSSLASSWVAKKFSTPVITAVSTAMTAAALLGYSFAPNLLSLCIFAIMLGLGAGAIDAVLNNYIALHYNAMHMNFLHCFYGVGVVVSPYIMSVMLEASSWRQGYRSIFMIQATISLLMILSIPLWHRVHHEKANSQSEPEQKVLSLRDMAKMPSVRLVWLLCVATNAIEAVCGVWGSTFLAYTHKLSASAAAGSIMFFYMGMALGRFLSGVFSVRFSPMQLIFICLGITILGIGLLFIPISAAAVAGLFLIGLGNGPIYPNIMYMTPKSFGEEISASVIGSQMAWAYGGFMAVPPVFGLIAQYIDTALFPCFVLLWFAAMCVALYFFINWTKNKFDREACA